MVSNTKMIEHIVSTHKNAKRVMRKNAYRDPLLAMSYDIDLAIDYLGKLTVLEAASSKWLDMWKGRIWKYEFKVNDLLASIVGSDVFADLDEVDGDAII
jgi:hypothetical protein